jgi:hypothetical protein
MTLAPVGAYLGSVRCDGTLVGGVTDAPITDRVNNVEVTSLGDTAVRRYPTIQDAEFKLSIVYDPNDAGQAKILASKANKTLLTYIRYLDQSSTYYTIDCYVGDIAWSGGPGDVVKMEVTLLPNSAAVLTYP